MRGACGMLAVAITALLVCCNADPHQNQEVSGNDHSGDRYENSGHKPRHLDSFGGRNFIREVREASRPSGFVPYFVSRRFDFGSSNGGKRDLWPFAAPVELGGYYGDGLPKRNFDEIDRSGLDNFVRKRNFDEIDQTSMPFPYKRSYHVYAPNNFDSL